MSDDEVIRFEITDYDLDNEFNPNRNRKTKREQQIYGVWAKDSDEDENEDNIRQRVRKPKDFSAPIGFIAGGVQQAGKKKEESKEWCPAWTWCVQWAELLGAPTVAALAGRALLPRWLAALAAWFNNSPPHSAVLASYTQFKVTYITPLGYKLKDSRLRQIYVSELLKYFPLDVLSVQKIMDNEVDLVDFSILIYIQHKLMNATLQLKNVQNFINDVNEKYDAVVVEWMYSELGAGLAAVFDCPLIWSSSMVPHMFMMSLIDEPPNPAYTFHQNSLYRSFTFTERVRQLWVTLAARAYIWVSQNKFEESYRSIYGPALLSRGRVLPSYDEIRYNASFVLGNGNPIISDSFATPKNFKDIGGYHITEPEPLPQDFQHIMNNASNGVIYFSFGSILSTKSMSETLQKSILDVFSAIDQTVIWKASEIIPNLPKNVYMVKWAPQTSILAHPKCALFITHAGLLSITEALHFGVPVIGLPFFADQNYNINKAMEMGFGKRLLITRNSVGNLKEIIHEMLGTPRYRQRAKELSAIYHHRLVPPGKELVFWIEHAIQTGGAVHLRSNSLRVYWYQKVYLDLVAVILIVIFIIISMLKYLMRIPRKIINKMKKMN